MFCDQVWNFVNTTATYRLPNFMIATKLIPEKMASIFIPTYKKPFFKSHLRLGGSSNKKNRVNTTKKRVAQPSIKLTARCEITKLKSVGVYLFTFEEGNSKVTGISNVTLQCKSMLSGYRLRLSGWTWYNYCFNKMKPLIAHTALVCRATFQDSLPEHFISWFFVLHLPSRSPDLSGCDIFLCSHKMI